MRICIVCDSLYDDDIDECSKCPKKGYLIEVWPKSKLDNHKF